MTPSLDIRLEPTPENTSRLQRMLLRSGCDSYTELVNDALNCYDHVLTESEDGRRVGSLDEDNHDFREWDIPQRVLPPIRSNVWN